MRPILFATVESTLRCRCGALLLCFDVVLLPSGRFENYKTLKTKSKTQVTSRHSTLVKQINVGGHIFLKMYHIYIMYRIVRLIQFLCLINSADHSPDTHNTLKQRTQCSERMFHSNIKATLHKLVTGLSKKSLLVHHLWSE